MVSNSTTNESHAKKQTNDAVNDCAGDPNPDAGGNRLHQSDEIDFVL